MQGSGIGKEGGAGMDEECKVSEQGQEQELNKPRAGRKQRCEVASWDVATAEARST